MPIGNCQGLKGEVWNMTRISTIKNWIAYIARIYGMRDTLGPLGPSVLAARQVANTAGFIPWHYPPPQATVSSCKPIISFNRSKVRYRR